MKQKLCVYSMLTVLLLAAMTLCACGETQEQPADTIIEPGLVQEETAAEEDELFTDLGEETTLEDLAAAQDKISSYYFEQTIDYPDASVSMEVWYCASQMKVITEVGTQKTVFYYNYRELTQITETPGSTEPAIGMYFDPNGADAPVNPLQDDYTACTLLGQEEIDGQLCLIVEAENGDKLWVSTKYGFPLQVEFEDHLGGDYTVAYRNIAINTVTPEDAAVPADLQVEYLR